MLNKLKEYLYRMSNNKVISITGKKTRRKTSNDAKCWAMLKEQISIGEVSIELKGIQMNDSTMVELFGQYLLGLYEQQSNDKKASNMKKKRAISKVIVKSKSVP